MSSPQTKHWDTNYSTPVVGTINGTRMLIVGGTDGMYHALKVNTGEKMWSVEVSKRAILNSALLKDNVAYITHGEENMDTTEMGMIAAIDATRCGMLANDAFKWKTLGFLPSFASPVMDNDRLYTVDNSAIVAGFDLKTGAKLWEKSLGTLQKGFTAPGRRQAVCRAPRTDASTSCGHPRRESRCLTTICSAAGHA